MNFMSKVGLWGKRHSPELLIAGSIISMSGAIALAILGTTKVKKVIDPAKEKLKDIREGIKMIPDNNPKKEELTKGLKKNMVETYAKAGLKVLWVYSPSILLTTLSISCMLGSHHIMKTRNIALSSAYILLDTGFKAYRNRVKEKIGEAAEEKLFSNITKEKIVFESEKSDGKKESQEIAHRQYNEAAPYEVLYDCGNFNWSKSAQDNFDWLMQAQETFNNRLRMRGYVFLYEIYDYLGFSTEMLGARRAAASRYLGWVYDEHNPKLDNFICFGLTKPGTRQMLPEIDRQIRNNEPSFWIRLNPTTNILEDENNPLFFAYYAKDDRS